MTRLFALLALPLLLAAAASALSLERPERPGPEAPWRGASILEDAQWRKSFLGSYGFLSGLEPEIQPTERELLREVIDLMESEPRAAAARLEQELGEGSSAALYFVLANLRFQTGDVAEAKAAYRTALEQFPDFRRAHKNLGLLFVQEGSCAEAAEHLSRAVELGDRDGRNYGLMGYCYINLEDYLAAEQAYRSAILQQPDEEDWKLGLARSLLAMEDYRPAIALFDTLLEEDPESGTLWKLQANAYIGVERPLSAAANLETVRMLGEADSSSLVLLGDIYMNEGVYELAKSAYLEVIERDGEAARFATARRATELLVRTRSFDHAQEILASIDAHYGKSLSRDDELEVLTLKAKVARGQGREGEAAELLERIVRRDGTRGEALLELAEYEESHGNTAKAELLLERAARLEDFEYPALLKHAQLLVAEREYPKAAELLRRALDIKREPRVERYLAKLDEVIRG